MGLSRKLGGGAASRAEAPVHVNYTWSTQAYTIKDILTKFRLPCVVQCSGHPGTVWWADFQFDMRQPLLLHTARTVRKVHARSLKVQEPSGQLEEFGPPLAIPEDYDGWFFPVGRQDPTTLPHHTRVEGVASSASRQFLVTTTLPAFTPAKAANSGAKHVQHEVSIGEVLTKVGVAKGEPSVTSSPSALVQRSRQSLRCLDENQHEVVIPFSHRALLFDVSDNYGPSNSGLPGTGGVQPTGPSTPGVVHTHTLVAVGNQYLPRVFRHVLGELPALRHAFTGLLRCYSVFTEETVMAATMSRVHLYSVSQESSCLELATDSSAKFKIALNASELKKTHQYALALKTCEELAPSYVRAIKTSFTVEPVVSALDDVDMSLSDSDLEQRMGNPEKGPSRSHGAVQMSFSSTSFAGENSSADVMHLDRDGGVTDTCDHESLGTDDEGDDESIMTDDVANSIIDTASLSDATDIMHSDAVSDVVEVEANSEFDFSWGQLKRAKSFSGSISPVTDDSETSSPDSNSDAEDSVVAQGLDSSVSQDSTLTKDANSSASEDTVVFRASAPSPVYANVPKKLCVFSTGQSDDASCVMSEPSGDPSTSGQNSDTQKLACTLQDNTVRSVWNITPTIDGQHDYDGKNNSLPTNSSGSPFISANDSKEVENPIWWGDRTDDSYSDSKTAISDFKQKHTVEDESNSSTLEHPPNITDKCTATNRQVSARLCPESTTSSQSMLAPRPLLSSRLSVHSEGSAQDLAIQRLERALNNATNFLKSSGPPSTQPIRPPRKGKAGSVNFHHVDEVYSGHDSGHGVQAPVQGDTVVPSCSSQTIPAWSSVTPRDPLSASTSKRSLSDHQTFLSADRRPFSLPDHQSQAPITPSFGHGHNTQLNAAHHPGDLHLESDLPQATHQHNDEQIDLDFVKALGDRLMAISRKSSLPKYQRLQPDMDAAVWSEHRQLRKKQQRAGSVPSHPAQCAADSGEDGGGHGQSAAANGAFSEDWDRAESTQREAILNDLDLLHEEVV